MNKILIPEEFLMVSSGLSGQADAVAEYMETHRKCYVCGKPHLRKGRKTCSDRCEEAYRGNHTLYRQIKEELK